MILSNNLRSPNTHTFLHARHMCPHEKTFQYPHMHAIHENGVCVKLSTNHSPLSAS